MIKIQPLRNDKIEEYGNIIKQKIVIKEVDIKYIEKIMEKHKITIENKEQFIQKANEFIKDKIENDIDLLIKGKLKEIVKLYRTYLSEYPEIFPKEISGEARCAGVSALPTVIQSSVLPRDSAATRA